MTFTKTFKKTNALAATLVLLWASTGSMLLTDMNRPAMAQTSTDVALSNDDIIVFPDRVIIPHPERHTGPTVENKAFHVDVSVEGAMAVTHITQVIKNNGSSPAQVTYLYPMPEDATYSSLSFTLNGKPVNGTIMDSNVARTTYHNLVRQQIDPALLEYADKKTAKLSLAPVMPGEEKEIKLTYSQVLKKDGGLTKFVYPFGLNKLNPSRTGGNPSDKADLKLSLHTPSALKTIYSPTHQPDIKRDGEQRALINLDLSKSPTGSTQQDNSFVLYFSDGNDVFSMNALAFKEPVKGLPRASETAMTDDGYFLLTIRAPESMKEVKRVSKDVLLVLDTSGSMEGEKLVQAKQAMRYVLSHLGESDRFNLIDFNTDVKSFKPSLTAATPAMRQQAIDFVANRNADGSTNIEGALSTAFKQLDALKADQRPDYVIFLTDGEPTVGMTDTPGLVNLAKKANHTHAKLFNFGVGYNLNTQLLTQLSNDNHGSTTYVEPNENLEMALTQFYNKIEYPVLTDVTVDYGNLDVQGVYPNQLTDLFIGSELIVLGRYHNGTKPTPITLKGKLNGKPYSFATTVDFSEAQHSGHQQLPRMWAARRIGFLLDTIHQNGESAELKNEVVSLSKQFGIMTPYTSFLALETEEKVKDRLSSEGYGPGSPKGDPSFGFSGGLARRAKAMDISTVTAGAAPEAMPAQSAAGNYHMASGRGAVSLKKPLNKIQNQANVADIDGAQSISNAAGGYELGVRHRDNKTFIVNKDGYWVDTNYDEAVQGKPTQLTFASPEYFALLDAHPEWSHWFSVATQVIIVVDGKAYQVNDPDKKS